MICLKIRRLQGEEVKLLERFLYNAIYQREGDKPLPYDIIYEPELIGYIADFGRLDDRCLVAEINNEVVGAVWCRIFRGDFRGYGFIDDRTPELSISVLKSHRGMGIGRQLMTEILRVLSEEGYDKVSLSVQKENYVTMLYKSFGFEVIKESDEGYIMKYDLHGV